MSVGAGAVASLCGLYVQYRNRPVNTKPPTKLPSVTGNWFHSHQSDAETFAPSSMPVGIMNMFTTECSKPCAKNVRIGSHIATILPTVDGDVSAITTPRQTIQLQRMAFVKTVTSPAKPCAE